MDVMERRWQLMAMQKQSLLPPGYRQVEYLQSSGVQYILTNITYTYGYRIKIETVDFGFYNSLGYYGWWNSASQNNMQTYMGGSDKRLIIVYGNDNNVSNNIGHPFSGIITTDGTQIKANNLSFNGNTVPPDIGVPFALFGYNRSTGVVNCTGRSRIYFAEFYNSGHELIGNFIPCIRKSDSKPGMYDTVSKTFYTNAGTGEFIVPA